MTFNTDLLEAVIFDMDGVLIDSEKLHERSGFTTFAHYGVEVPENVFDSFKGKTDRNVVEWVVANLADRPLDVDELLEFRRQTYSTYIDELQMIPGALEMVKLLLRTHRLAVTTSASTRNQRLAFDKFDLYPFFEFIITSDDIERPKPDPQPYATTVSRLSMEPHRCLVIEDSVNGILSAKGAGCQVVGITSTFPAAKLEEAGAHAVIEHYGELKELLGLEA